MSRHPVLFVSHGAPDLLLAPGRTGMLWQALGEQLPAPKAILAVSAHWETPVPTVSTAANPRTIHDFAGFPPALYRQRYAAPGAPALAERVLGLLRDAGLPVEADAGRGFDHGAWAPLSLLYPAADIPVTQLSIQSHAGPEWHYRLGEALRPLRQEGVLVLASGSVTHNLARLAPPGTPPAAFAVDFADWLAAKLQAEDIPALLDYRRQSPTGAACHPREEHLLPLFVAIGVGGESGVPQRHTPEFSYGSLAMDAYLWSESTTTEKTA
ncbi:MAG: DODA-type extradiol aromatic ring-opening family dioxygenase [Betaproteobacteria bacterium]